MIDDGENSIWSIAIVIFLVFLGVKVWNWVFPSSSDKLYNSSYSSSYSSNPKGCIEPENPYDEGSGHYAGFQWGEDGNYCDGNSNSFIEGCEEYEAQKEAYNTCLSSD